MAFCTSIFLFLATTQLLLAADEVVLNSSEKKSPDEVDQLFGETDPAKITEVRREPQEIAAKKEKKSEGPPPAGGEQPMEMKELAAPVVPLADPPKKMDGAVKMEDKKEEEKPLPEPEKKIEKRRARQHRQKKPPSPGEGAADPDGIENA